MAFQIYAEGNDITQENFRQLLLQAYKLAMDHYTEGPQICSHLPNILNAIIDSAVSNIFIFKITCKRKVQNYRYNEHRNKK